jgi:hypothetical protein
MDDATQHNVNETRENNAHSQLFRSRLFRQESLQAHWEQRQDQVFPPHLNPRWTVGLWMLCGLAFSVSALLLSIEIPLYTPVQVLETENIQSMESNEAVTQSALSVGLPVTALMVGQALFQNGEEVAQIIEITVEDSARTRLVLDQTIILDTPLFFIQDQRALGAYLPLLGTLYE